MKAILKILTYIALIFIGAYAALFILKTIDSHGVTDQFNPLVKEDDSYVKTTAVSSRIDEQLRSYRQNAYNKTGEMTQLTYTATYDIKPNRYLKITHKGHHVEAFEEVEKKEVPSKILEKLSHS
ncbi:YxeA family protein [Staphylococcus argenteus]|uniref:YxeA family protein n=1 Tax=Staphylococcus argenteus TaxID=985002 RepID=UPI001FB9CA21|nr:YxeA family protein [Staphylococcus argenteus]MCG9795750.1 YxeA family protein [Staphylococcus argenteus]GJF44992.1 YxeA family protein [Staphylococcus argenteus]GJF53704.1 YxeA family protein [Staphylococcus argenteus]GJF60189.1 YxeA family protein [Staphylococcus argenteus]GJF73345.1 YxeA family protein [Staphylococcus argenteus]